jgi:TRAP-type mannitol/chloroaromatic compound transport system permease small subunit
MAGRSVFDNLDHAVGRLLSWASWLALPIVILLFLQWPLRDVFKAYSREANDLGQWIFALYVAACFTSATRAGTHLHADMLARRYSPRLRRGLFRAGVAIGLIPWALFVVIAGKNIIVPSALGLEAFPDTANPGYFLIKLALWLLGGLILAQGLVDLARTSQRASE